MTQMVKYPPALQETWVPSLDGEDPWRRAWQPTPVFLPGEFHELRGLGALQSMGRKESDTTEPLNTHKLKEHRRAASQWKRWGGI